MAPVLHAKNPYETGERFFRIRAAAASSTPPPLVNLFPKIRGIVDLEDLVFHVGLFRPQTSWARC